MDPNPLELVRLPELMERTRGREEMTIGLIDGPVAPRLPELAGSRVREVSERRGACSRIDSVACLHGTFVAGILVGARGSTAPAICPECTLIVRPIFAEAEGLEGNMPSATPEELARAIRECADAGARVINISASLLQPATSQERVLGEALDYVAGRGIIVVVAAGNQRVLGGTALTRHPWVIPVVAYGLHGRPMDLSNLGIAIGRRGLGAPGERITSLGAGGGLLTLGGTSAAAPFVTGAVALLWSEFPAAPTSVVKRAVMLGSGARRNTVVPPLLDAWSAYQVMRS